MKMLLLVCFTAFLFFSCKKNNDSPAPDTGVVTPDILNGWTKKYVIDSGTNAGLNDVWFTNQNEGYVLSYYNVLATKDGGASWQQLSSAFMSYNIQFLDSLNGFLDGNGNMFFTHDGAKTWNQASSSGGIYFQFVTRNTGFYTSATTGELFGTHNGGSSWSSLLKPTVPGVKTRYPFFFADSLRGYSLMNGSFSTTTDGGAHWQTTPVVTSASFEGFYKMQFLDSLTGFTGAPMSLLKTTDGGKTWLRSFTVTDQTGAPAQDFVIPRFFDANNGYVMSNKAIYRTTDGGNTWTMSCKLGNSTFSGISFIDMNTGWASTFDGAVLRLKP